MAMTRRPTGRTQPRSPLPHIPTSRPFLPPSHYAAAARIQYDESNRVIETKKGHLNDTCTRAFLHTYPYDAEPDSQSSFEFKSTINVEDKLPIQPKSTRRSRRESLLNDLPQLEANLLPSLRDTIDRMTKSPSQTEPSSGSHLTIPRRSGTSRSSRSLSPSYASRTKPITKFITPELTTREADDILTPRTNTPVKPPRSNLRTPAEKINLKASGDSPPSTVRSILKKMPKHDAVNPPISGGVLSRRSTVSNGAKPAPSNLRSRSRTDPGTLPTTICVADQPPTPSVVEPTNTQATPRPQASGIPRLQSRRKGTGAWWSTDESDLDGQEKPRGRDRRQLIVPRTVSQSTSESETERRKGGVRRNSLVGLGIDLLEKKKVNSGASRQIPTSSHPDISLRSTRRITGDRTPVQPNRSTFDTPSEQKQRREALRDIVSNLNLDDYSTEDESEYDVEESVAISGPQILAGATQAVEQRSDADADSDNEQRTKGAEGLPPPGSRKLRPRSTSHTPTPTFLVSPNPDIISTTKIRTPLLNKRHLGASRMPIRRVQGQSKYESSSRSPIIPQIDTPPTPAALRRHSVYHRSASPSPLTPVIGSDNEDKRLSTDRRSFNAGVSKEQRGSSQQRREGVSIDVNSRVDAKVYAAATATDDDTEDGVSDSNGAYGEHRDDVEPSLPRTESDLSSVGSIYWGDNSDSELSPAAETLFQKLGQGRVDRKGSEKAVRSSVVVRTPSPSPVPTPDNLRQSRIGSRHEDHLPRSRLISPSSPLPPVPVEPSENFNVDDNELRRQDMIIEIQQCEEAFVKRLQIFVQLFILPLRVQDTKEWIAGVPTEIARLLDWLEDIVVLHTQILTSLDSTRDAQYPTVERIAESIRAFVPRLEVYQPYLVNLERVIGLAEELFESEESDFAEFVRLQEKGEECEGWNFQTFLIEPVNLLARFPGLFNRLLELTPKSHRDYMPTLALVRSTEMFIRVMTEVKLREDEYDRIQQFAARIQGLPPSSHLATRERRLLHHGVLHLIDVEPAVAGTSTLIRYFPPNANAIVSVSNRSGTTMHPWDSNGRARSGSTSSSSTGVSFSSLKASSSGASSIFFSSFKMSLPKGRLKPSTTKTKRPPSPSPAPRGIVNNLNTGTGTSQPHGTPVQVFVFSDLLVLAALDSGSGSGTDGDYGWTLLNHIGTTRILDIKQPQEVDVDRPGHDSQDTTSASMTIEVLSIDTTRNLNLNAPSNRDLDNSSIFLLHMEIPSNDNAGQETALARRRWTSALLRSYRSTLCSLATPPDRYNDNHYQNHAHGYDPHLDAALDTHEAVSVLLASGLPLPKSPSMIQCHGEGSGLGVGGSRVNVIGAGDHDAGREEREERGWWAVRFRQVFREAVRRDGEVGLLEGVGDLCGFV